MPQKDTKLLQAILDGQRSFEKKVDGEFEKVNKGLDEVNKRLDMQGSQLAYLEDEAPTIKDFNRLKKKVVKLEAIVYKIV